MRSIAEWDEVRWVENIIDGIVADAMHIVPVDDLVGHEQLPNCVCGPHIEHLGGEDYLVAHHALDKRP